MSDIIECKDKYHKNLFTNGVKRKAAELIEDNRLEQPKLSNQGRERLTVMRKTLLRNSLRTKPHTMAEDITLLCTHISESRQGTSKTH